MQKVLNRTLLITVFQFLLFLILFSCGKAPMVRTPFSHDGKINLEWGTPTLSHSSFSLFNPWQLDGTSDIVLTFNSESQFHGNLLENGTYYKISTLTIERKDETGVATVLKKEILLISEISEKFRFLDKNNPFSWKENVDYNYFAQGNILTLYNPMRNEKVLLTLSTLTPAIPLTYDENAPLFPGQNFWKYGDFLFQFSSDTSTLPHALEEACGDLFPETFSLPKGLPTYQIIRSPHSGKDFLVTGPSFWHSLESERKELVLTRDEPRLGLKKCEKISYEYDHEGNQMTLGNLILNRHP